MTMIKSVDFHRYGGTAKIEMDDGRQFYIDKRLKTRTPMGLYLDNHPSEGGELVHNVSTEVELIAYTLRDYVSNNPDSPYISDITKLSHEFDAAHPIVNHDIQTLKVLQVVEYEHHGRMVKVREDLKGKHRDNCLCMICEKLVPGDKEKNCPIAQAVFENCVKYGLCTPMYECPECVVKS